MPGSDYLLIQGCIDGKRMAQAALYNMYCPRMITICMRYAKNKEEAEEIMQEGFYRVFKYISQFRHEGSFEGWIKKIMINAALQKYTPKSGLYPVVGIDSATALSDTTADIDGVMDVKQLLQLVQTLPTAYRLVFNLYVFEGFKHREIAAMLGIVEGTSKSNLSAARIILQKALRTSNAIRVAKKISL